MAQPDFEDLDTGEAPPTLNGLAESMAIASAATASDAPVPPHGPQAPAERSADTPEWNEATRYLRKQARMLDIQMEHLSEQRGLSLSHLRLRRIGDYLKLGLQGLTIVVGLGVALALAAFVQEARQSQALVIEPLRAPQDLAARGLDGATLATQLLDKLTAIEDATNSARAPQTYAHNWGDDIKVVIPETGVSIGELRRYLHQWLGHETHITGEVYRGWLPSAPGARPAPAPDGLYVTVRAGSASGSTVKGADADLDAMLKQAAERLVAVTQPYRYAVYLARTNRPDEGVEAIKAIAARGSAVDRPWAYSYWGGLIAARTGDIRAAEEKTRAALRLDPKLAIALDNLAGDESLLGHDQAAADAFAGSVRGLQSTQAASLSPSVRPILLGWARLRLAEAQGDFEEVERQAAVIEGLPDYDDSTTGALMARAAARALRHEPTASRELLSSLTQTDTGAEYRSALQWDPNLLPRLIQLRMLDDWPGLARTMADSPSWAGDSPVARAALATKVSPSHAIVLAKTGELTAAETLAGGLPGDCDACLRTRARIAALNGDAATSDRLFAEARARAPRLPQAELEWARAKLERGDARGAAALARAAAAKGPRWADPLALEGEALLKAGDLGGAATRFAAAERFAPHWGRLHLMWGDALARSGRNEAARALWRRAAAEDLSTADRTLVADRLRK